MKKPKSPQPRSASKYTQPAVKLSSSMALPHAVSPEYWPKFYRQWTRDLLGGNDPPVLAREIQIGFIESGRREYYFGHLEPDQGQDPLGYTVISANGSWDPPPIRDWTDPPIPYPKIFNIPARGGFNI